MGFGKNEQRTYLSVKCGQMVGGKKRADGSHPIEANWCEGRLLSIAIVDGEFNKQKTKEWQCKFVDDNGEAFILCFTARALFAKGFFASIRSIDLRRPFKVRTWGSKENEKISFCKLEQGGKDIAYDPTLQAIKITNNDWSKAAPIMWDTFTWLQNALANQSMQPIAASAEEEAEARMAGVTDDGATPPTAEEKADGLPF